MRVAGFPDSSHTIIEATIPMRPAWKDSGASRGAYLNRADSATVIGFRALPVTIRSPPSNSRRVGVPSGGLECGIVRISGQRDGGHAAESLARPDGVFPEPTQNPIQKAHLETPRRIFHRSAFVRMRMRRRACCKVSRRKG